MVLLIREKGRAIDFISFSILSVVVISNYDCDGGSGSGDCGDCGGKEEEENTQ